jgi:hypothetical protein
MFCRATELPKFCFGDRASFDRWDVSSCGAGPKARVGQGSLLSGMSGFDSARCSIRIAQEERARPIYQRALKGPGASTGARRSKVQKLESLV